MVHPDSVPNSFGEYAVRRVPTVPMASAPLIEQALPVEDEDIVWGIYHDERVAAFFREQQIDLLDFGGGEFGITPDMLLKVPFNTLKAVKAKGAKKTIGVRNAKRIQQLCQEAMDKEPYY